MARFTVLLGLSFGLVSVTSQSECDPEGSCQYSLTANGKYIPRHATTHWLTHQSAVVIELAVTHSRPILYNFVRDYVDALGIVSEGANEIHADLLCRPSLTLPRGS